MESVRDANRYRRTISAFKVWLCAVWSVPSHNSRMEINGVQQCESNGIFVGMHQEGGCYKHTFSKPQLLLIA